MTEVAEDAEVWLTISERSTARFHKQGCFLYNVVTFRLKIKQDYCASQP